MTVNQTQLLVSGPKIADPVKLSEAVEMMALRIRHGEQGGILDMAAMDGSGITRYVWSIVLHEVQE